MLAFASLHQLAQILYHILLKKSMSTEAAYAISFFFYQVNYQKI